MGGTITRDELNKHMTSPSPKQPGDFMGIPQDLNDKVRHGSGATSSHFSPFNFYPTYEGQKLTSMRFAEGNRKHEDSDPVYSNANWLKAFRARDVKFFRDRAGHALEHIVAEMRGNDDIDPGGNLGALGWFQDVMAFVKANDPFFYGAIQGKWSVNDVEMLEFYKRQGIGSGISNQT